MLSNRVCKGYEKIHEINAKGHFRWKVKFPWNAWFLHCDKKWNPYHGIKGINVNLVIKMYTFKL